MNKNIKRIITLVLSVNAFCTISAITPGVSFDITTKAAYADSYSPSSGELKTLKIKSTNDDTLSLRNGFNDDTVKLNDDKEYWVKLTDDSDGIKIDADVKGEDYIARIFTFDSADATAIKPGEKISLGKGDTTLYVRTYESLSDFRKAKDETKDVRVCKSTYTVNVRKTKGSANEDTKQDAIYLSNIDINKGDLTFVKQRTSYDVKVGSSIDEIKITAKPENSSSRVRIDGALVDSSDDYKRSVYLDDGKNEIKIKITDDKDNQRTYTLNVQRGDSDNQDNVYLDDLTISEGNLDFSKKDTDYNIDLDESVDSIKIGANPEDDGFLVTIGGKEVKSSDDFERKVSLDKGKNTVDVVVKDEVNDKKRTYTLNINRGKETQTTQENTAPATTDPVAQTNDKKTGWVQTAAGVQYYDENGNIVKSSWVQDKTNNKWYLVDANGIKLLGWQVTDGKWYMLDSTNGDMKTGWYKEETTAQNNSGKIEKWYYLNDDGSMKIGWLTYNDKWYYFNTNGAMQKGWIVDSNSKYYLDNNGIMVTGTQTIDSKQYKFATNGTLII